MDIEKLVEQLNDWSENFISNLCAGGKLMCGDLCIEQDCIVIRAADALSMLQAENMELRDLWSDANIRLTDALVENGNLRAELEQGKRHWQ